MKQRTIFDVGQLLEFVLGALVVVTVYLVVPLTITLSPLIESNWGRFLAAVALLVLGEIAIFRILKTSSKEYEDYCAE